MLTHVGDVRRTQRHDELGALVVPAIGTVWEVAVPKLAGEERVVGLRRGGRMMIVVVEADEGPGTLQDLQVQGQMLLEKWITPVGESIPVQAREPSQCCGLWAESVRVFRRRWARAGGVAVVERQQRAVSTIHREVSLCSAVGCSFFSVSTDWYPSGTRYYELGTEHLTT